MIGLFDSGLGGLSVVRHVRRALPTADLLYVADRAHAPYGTKDLAEVREIAHNVASWLRDRGAESLVVACNTASAAALESLRIGYPDLPIIGMEPAVKPAASTTSTGTVAVFATAATFQGRLFESVVSRFAADVAVVTQACPEWVELVEHGKVDGPEVERSVAALVAPARAAGADTAVLACTHFSFLAPTIERVGEMTVIDPAPAVAAQVARVTDGESGAGRTSLATTGDLGEFALLAREIAGIDAEVIPFA